MHIYLNEKTINFYEKYNTNNSYAGRYAAGDAGLQGSRCHCQ